ncbi:MAG: ATP-binding protein [Deinococcales bacterium]
MNLRWRLTLIIAPLVWGLVLSLSLALYSVASEELHRSFVLQLESVADLYSQSILKSGRLQPSTATKQLEGLTCLLFTQDGRLLDRVGDFSFRLTPVQLRQKGTFTTQANAFVGQQRVSVVRPLPATQNRRIIVVSAVNTVAQKGLLRLRGIALLWLCIAAIGSVALGYGLAMWLSRPLRHIAQTADLVRQGKFNARIENADRKDEIGVLKRSLNTMLERQEQLVQSQRRFIADAAHDLRTPLTVMRTELEICLRHPRDNQEYQKRIQQLLQRVCELCQLCENLLSVAKLESNPNHSFEDFLLLDALEHSLENIQYLSTKRFHLKIDHSLEAHGHAQSIARLIANLLENASRAAKENFGLRAERRGEQIRLEIWDDGPGIAQEQQEYLFRPFAKEKKSEGAGLGLTIAQDIAQMHGTRIELIPSSIGATFALTIAAATRYHRSTGELF